MSDFKNSIAQDNVQFPIETVIETVPGAAYSKAIIFMHKDYAATLLPGVVTPNAGDKINLTSSNYGAITAGGLKSWLIPFFKSAINAELAVVLYDTDTTQEQVDPDTQETTTVSIPASAPLESVYEAQKYFAYFKFLYSEDRAKYQTENVSLAQLCLADPLYSAHWLGISDTGVLTQTSAFITALNAVNADTRVVYNPDATINAALAQLGDTLGAVNSTGTPIGNDMDMHAFSTIAASGALDADGNRLNLTTTEKAALDAQKIGYNTWVDGETNSVVTEGSLTLKGTVCGAEWVKSYIEFVCKVATAQYITQRNRFRNNEQYQAILLIVTSKVKPFVDFGRLADFAITAPLFKELPKTADTLVVNKAWKVGYIDRFRNVTIYGTLYITQPSK
jgi:hypothetical protein